MELKMEFMNLKNNWQAPLFSVIILTYNAQKYIKKCIDSVLGQNYPNIEIIVIDNNSVDETKNLLRTKYQAQNIKIIFNENNIGFAAGQNQGIRVSGGKYILCLNQDAWISKDFIKNAVEILEKDEKIAAIQGKLIRYDFQNNKILDIIDTTGLTMLKNRRIINRDQGTSVQILKRNETEEVFGADGAAPIYRREALEDTKLPKLEQDGFEYFDEDFFIYKEDVDLSWRLRLYGWRIIYAPFCVGYHSRGAGDSAASDYSDILKERRKISGLAKYYSWKNQRLMQIKNETLQLLLKHIFFVLLKEVFSWLYILIFEEPYAVKSIVKMFRQLPRAYQKRKIIMSKKQIGDKEMTKWFK